MVPMAAPSAPSSDNVVSGVLAEVIQVSQYTYLRLATSSGEIWAAVPSTTAAQVGQNVAVATSTQMTNFTSKTLGRTFPSIWFGALAGQGTPSTQQLPSNHPAVGAPASSSGLASAMAAVGHADEAMELRVTDIFAERLNLAGKLVRIRGVAASVTADDGASRVHFKDGSGSADKKDDGLTVLMKLPPA
jgi:hypothetical protein